MSAVEDRNPWLAADLRDAANHKYVVAELTQARDKAYRTNLAKSRFLAIAGHDLRQPLQRLSLLNGALRRMVTEPDAVDALRQQDQAIRAMSRLLNALLDTSKLESRAIKPELTDFAVAALLIQMDKAASG
jgi:two-component system, sensor histidine kinase